MEEKKLRKVYLMVEFGKPLMNVRKYPISKFDV